MAVVFRRAKPRPAVEYVLGSPGQVDFTLQRVEYIPGRSELEVYINGLLAYPDLDYTVVDPRTIRLAEPLPESAELAFKVRSW